MEMNSKLSDEQKSKLRSLYKSHMLKSMSIALKSSLILLLSNVVVMVLNYTVVHSPLFVFLGGVANAAFAFPYLFRESAKEQERIKKEIKNIISE